MQAEWHEEVTSTFDEAARRAEAGAPHGTVVAARRQTAGRGRHGRAWESPHGGLWMTVILRPGSNGKRLAADIGTPSLSLVAAAAIAASLERLGLPEVEVRWPNDLYADGRKLAGVLVEARWQGGQPDSILLGVGVNVNVDRRDWSDDVAARATSMSLLTGKTFDVNAVLSAVADAVLDACAHPTDIDRVRRRCGTLKRRVRAVLDNDSVIEGVATDLGAGGSLIVQAADGPRELYSCREVTLL